MSKISLARFTSLLLCALALGAYGGNYTWQSAADGSWNAPANWGAEAVPSTADDYALFPTLTTPFTVTDVAPRTLAEIQVTGGTQATFDLGGGKLTMDDGSTTRTHAMPTSRILVQNSALTLKNGAAQIGFIYAGKMATGYADSLTLDNVDMEVSGNKINNSYFAINSQFDTFTFTLQNGSRLSTTNSVNKPYLFYQGAMTTLVVSNATLATRGFNEAKTWSPRVIIGDHADVYFGAYYNSSVAGSSLVCVDSTFTMASAAGLMPSASDTTLGFARSTLNLGAINGAYSLYPNASGVTIVLTNCTTTLAGGIFFSTAGAGSTVRLEGGSVSMAGMINLPQPNVTVVLKDLTVTPAGGVSIASTGAFIVLEGSAELRVDAASKRLDSGTVGGAVLTDPSGLKFVLDPTPAASAPVKMNAANSSSKFYGNTAIVVDASVAGEAVDARTYPLVYSADAFSTGKADYEAFLTLLRQHATLPTGATLGLSEDKKTICVTLPASANVVYVGFEYDNGVGIVTNKILKGGKTTAPAAEFREGYVFSGWTRDAGVTVLTSDEVAQLTFNADTTFVAQYKADSKTAVDIPTVAESAVYTGAVNKPAIAENEGYTIDWGEGDWTHVGAYTVTLTLTDTSKYIWSDGSSDPKAFGYTITQATNAWTEEPTVATTWTVGTVPTHSLGTATFGTATMTPSDLSALAVGAHTVTFTVTGTADYTGLQKEVAVKVRPQGLGPTGDPDTEARVYTWKNAETLGFWYDSYRWTPDATPAFGYPANAFASAVFDGAACTVTGEPDDTVYTLGGLTVKGSSVTLSGGSYWSASAYQFSGTSPSLTLTAGACLAPASGASWKAGSISVVKGTRIVADQGSELSFGTGYQNLKVTVSDVSIAVTGATVRTGFNVRNAPNFRGDFHNATFNGALELAGGTAGTDYNQLVTFSGVDSQLAFATGSSAANSGLTLRFAKGVSAAFPSTFGPSGTDVRMEFMGDNAILSSQQMPVGTRSMLYFGAGVTMTNGLGLVDFGMCRFLAAGTTDSRTIISNATIKANNQIYMPKGDRAFGAGCGVTFEGDHPLVTANTATYIGKATPADGEVLPSWRFILPTTPYAQTPMQISSAANDLHIAWNTPIELDLTAVEGKSRYPLFYIENLAGDPDLTMLTDAMSAWVFRKSGRRSDAKARVKLGWDVTTKTVFADVANAPGLVLFVR